MSEAEEVTFVAAPSIVWQVAKACYDDPDARCLAERDDLPEFEDTDEGVQRFWRFIACAALNASWHLELIDAAKDLLEAAERHIFADECIAQREALRDAIAKARCAA